MRMYDIIQKKRDGAKLTDDEIRFFVSGFVSGDIPDYQASALLMAICIRGLDDEETLSLTYAMARSGETADLSALYPVADKHSTGGVADSTTLIAAPLAASCGLNVAKMSGRGLGHTGGTLDKLESIPGMNVSLTLDRFISQIKAVGVAVTGQTMSLCPADKKLYALRDVTATVESIPLIASSIMSKKIAAGADVIILDVKTGNGAFMQSYEDAKKLADLMVRIGNGAGKKTAAVISDMSQPLGTAIGNSLEVIEAIEILQCKKEGDLLTVALELSKGMLFLSGKAKSESEAQNMLREALFSGRALDKFAQMIAAQGGDPKVVSDTSLMPRARHTKVIKSEKRGYLGGVDCRRLGAAAGILGAGRQRIGDRIDPASGIVVIKRIGDEVEAGEPLCELHSGAKEKIDEAEKMVLDSLAITPHAEKPTLILSKTY